MAGTLNTPEDAWRILIGAIEPLASESRLLEDARGRWLDEPLSADADIPPAPRAAMDGFAARSADLLTVPVRLAVTAEVAAGADLDPPLAPGSCVRIFTGATMPTAADTVIPVEQTSSGSFQRHPDDAFIEVDEHPVPGEHVFARGGTARAGHILLTRGTRLGPRQLAVAVAAGRTHVRVHLLPRIRILNTGAELLEPGCPAAPHRTRNSNGPMLKAALIAAGFSEVTRSVVRDDVAMTTGALVEALAGADAVVITGGISAGRYDHVAEAVEAAGARILFRGVAMKPGKPQLFARTAGGGAIFGLPGNPVSSIVGFYEFVLPALRRMAGCAPDRCRPELALPLGEDISWTGDRTLLLPAVLQTDERGTRVMPRAAVDSADLVTGGVVDGAIVVPAATGDIAAGAIVRFRPWGDLGS